MIGIQKQTKSFSLGTFLFVFFLALSFHFNLDVHLVYADSAASELKTAATAPAGTPAKTPASGDDMGNPIANGLMTVFKGLLYGILVFLAFIASVAAWAFLYVLDVSHLQAIMGNPVVWEMWKIVRDFFNLFFIFGLLLVAFSTIFQVSKFGGLKSVWSIVLAALFINFSFPIARMMIDVGNVMMYSFLTDMFGMTGESLTKGILGTAGLADILVPDGFQKSYQLKFYLIAIVCMFMFATSFMTLAFMMLLRLVWLPILVMFSPLGFAGSAIPGMSGFSKQWWDRLIKNVFFGPIAVFMMLIAVKFLATWGSSNAMETGFSQAAISSSTASGTLISGVVYMTIPIIFFWIAITSAEKMSSDASGIASSLGSKFLKKMASGVKDGALWAPRKGWQKTKDGSKKVWGNSFPGRKLAESQARRDEMKKYKEEAEKQANEARMKPGQEAARASMNKSDMDIITKGKAPGASAKQKAAGLAAQKRYNKRLQTSNVEEMKKQKESIENSGLVGIDSTSDEAFKMTNPHAPGFDVTRDGYAKRAANAEKFKTSLNDRDEFVDFVRRDAPTASSKINSLIGMNVADAVPRHIKGTPKEAGFIAEYTARQVRAQRAFANIQHDLGVDPNAVLDKAELASMRSFMSWRMDHVVGEGADFDTDRDPIVP